MVDIAFFLGFDDFLPFTTSSFVTAYIGLPVFVVFWAGYKAWYRSRVIPPEKVDLISGVREINEAEARFYDAQEAAPPRTMWRRLWDAM